MTNNDKNTAALQSEISELLEAMILELELRGCEMHDDIIKRALAMQKKVAYLAPVKHD